jgi:hypothetical protein
MATTIMTDLAANTSDKLLNETLIAYDKQNCIHDISRLSPMFGRGESYIVDVS